MINWIKAQPKWWHDIWTMKEEDLMMGNPLPYKLFSSAFTLLFYAVAIGNIGIWIWIALNMPHLIPIFILTVICMPLAIPFAIFN